MKITIHRGTNQIGGCVTEIESGGNKVFIDFGEQLPGTEKKEFQPINDLIVLKAGYLIFQTQTNRESTKKLLSVLRQSTLLSNCKK
jgi:mRNA degradation ribonuclease J1/J2